MLVIIRSLYEIASSSFTGIAFLLSWAKAVVLASYRSTSDSNAELEITADVRRRRWMILDQAASFLQAEISIYHDGEHHEYHIIATYHSKTDELEGDALAL